MRCVLLILEREIRYGKFVITILNKVEVVYLLFVISRPVALALNKNQKSLYFSSISAYKDVRNNL